jgi:hypothetical protein
MFQYCTQHGRNMGCLGVVPGGGGGSLVLDVTRNMLATWSQYDRNIAPWTLNSTADG